MAFDRTDPTAMSVPSGPLWMLFIAHALPELALQEGELTLGGARALPDALATFELVDGRWERGAPDAPDPRLDTVRLAEPTRAACLAASGCYGLSPAPDTCRLPCPCPETPLATEPYPVLECRLPTPRTPPCYRPVGTLSGLVPPGANVTLGSISVEGPRWWLYFSSSHFEPPLERAARVVIDSNLVVQPATLERVLLGLGSREVARPWVRADGLELWFESTTSTDTEVPTEAWIASRARWSQPFLRPRPVSPINTAPVLSPLILADYRTLLYRSLTNGVLAVTRSSTIAGTVEDRMDLSAFSIAPNEGAAGLTLGCDRQSILYHRTNLAAFDQRLVLASLGSFVPLMLDNTGELRDDQGRPLDPGDFVGGHLETPDCRHLLVSSGSEVRIFEATACP
ncbi:MAG: hypothetical protein IPG45_33485 [Deltaproteobacteria bacterium]|nr:hypothetical protein [Deltaproteobacteria bacterium]